MPSFITIESLDFRLPDSVEIEVIYFAGGFCKVNDYDAELAEAYHKFTFNRAACIMFLIVNGQECGML